MEKEKLTIQKPFSMFLASTLILLISLNPAVTTLCSLISDETQNKMPANGTASSPAQDNMTFTSGKTLSLTTNTTVNFTLGPKFSFSSGITIQFTDTNSTPILPGFYGQLLTGYVPSELVPCSWWEILNASSSAGTYFHVDNASGNTFHINQVVPTGIYPMSHGETITAEHRINNITQGSKFLIRDPLNWTLPANSWWSITSPVGWKAVKFHVDWADVNGTFHLDQVIDAIPQAEHSYMVTAEQAVADISQGDYFIAKDPASTPEPCTWWEIIEPTPSSGRGFHVDWKDVNGTFHIDQVDPSNITFSPPTSEIFAEKRISAIQTGMSFKFEPTGGYDPNPGDWWEILYPQELNDTEFRIDSVYGGRIHVSQVYPSNKTLSKPVCELIVEKKIHTITKDNSFKVIDPTSWVPEAGSWWNVTLPTNWADTVFHVDSNYGTTGFRVDFVNKTPSQLTIPPWSVTAERIPVHDIAVLSVSPNLTSVYQGWTCPIFVTVKNCGNFSETFFVDVEYVKNQQGDGPPVTTSPMKIQDLQPGESKILCYYWITKGVSPDTYGIKACLHGVSDEIPINNEVYSFPTWVTVVTPLSLFFNEGFGDYTPTGMPDFDQRQDNWTNPTIGNWSYCGPTAVANSLWWYDSKFEPNQPPIPPPERSDEFPLVSSYIPQEIDDHDPENVQMLIVHLAKLMDTDGQRTSTPATAHNGTMVGDMKAGLTQYLSWAGVNPLGDVNGDGTVDQTDIDIVNDAMGSTPGMSSWNMAADIFPVTQNVGQWPNLPQADNIVNASDLELVEAHLGETGLFSEYSRDRPDLFEIENEIKQGRDVTLSIGYWYWNLSAWTRNPKNHFVTVAGINASQKKIYISDPIFDAREAGLISDGYVPIPHTYPHDATVHNNAQFVSYDGYALQYIPSPQFPLLCPGGNWTLKDYPGKPGVGWLSVIESAIVASSLGMHDLTITNIKTSKDGCKPMPVVCQNCSMTINITLTNRGNFTETFNLTSYINSSVLASQSIALESGGSTTITAIWNTTGLDKGNYSISAYVQSVLFETHMSDNSLTWGLAQVTMLGDINGDRIVDIFDLARFGISFGSKPGDPNWDPNADINDDGLIDIFDLVIAALHFGDIDP